MKFSNCNQQWFFRESQTVLCLSHVKHASNCKIKKNKTVIVIHNYYYYVAISCSSLCTLNVFITYFHMFSEVYADNAKKHPNYQRGIWSLDRVLQEFLNCFDDPDNKDGVVSLSDFIKYYENVSCTIDDDSYFELMMVNSWDLDGKNKNDCQQQKRKNFKGKRSRKCIIR